MFYQVGTNKHYGTGILISKSMNPKFKKILDRNCKATIKTNNNHLIIAICAYAPTMEVKEIHIKENVMEATSEPTRVGNGFL